MISLEETKEIASVEEELKKLGLSDEEIKKINTEVDGIIEGVFDTYFSNLYE